MIFNHGVRLETKNEINLLINHYEIKKNFSLKVFDIGNKIKKDNFQKKSREIRLSYAIKYAKNNKINNIFFGHHYDDLLETILLRKIQISGLDGLTNIFSNKFEGLLFNRPLLTTKKIEIIKFAKLNKLLWFEDKTNIRNIYTRNKIRNYLSASKNKEIILSYKKKIYEIDALNDHLTNIVHSQKNTTKIEKEIFLKLPTVLQKRILIKALSLINPINTIRNDNIVAIQLIIENDNNLPKKRSIKGGVIDISKNYFTFIPIKTFKELNQ